MEFEKPESSFGYCIFCDDIRQEIANKLTYVGVFYGPELNVLGALPANIGKFCIQAVFKQRFADGFEPMTFEVHMPGDDPDKPSARVEVNSEQVATALPAPPSDEEDPFLQIMSVIVFNPLEIRQEGKVQVSVLRSGKRYRLGKMTVRAAPIPNPPVVDPVTAPSN
jgi:hypothetical protein